MTGSSMEFIFVHAQHYLQERDRHGYSFWEPDPPQSLEGVIAVHDGMDEEIHGRKQPSGLGPLPGQVPASNQG